MPYSRVISRLVTKREEEVKIIPTIIPNWDHTPRSGNGGTVITGSTPKLFAKHVCQVLDVVKNKPEQERLVFLKSWNEWGEGNYMEPDLQWGRQYVDILKKMTDNND